MKGSKLPRTLLVGSLLFLAALPALAQSRRDSVEISPFGSYVFGGRLEAGSTDVWTEDVDVDDDAGWGLRIGYNVTDRFGVEVAYLHEATEIVSRGGLFEPDTPLADLDVDVLEGTMLFHMGNHRFRPFFSLGMGATRLDLTEGDFNSDTRFEASLGGGFKIFFVPEVGMRLDVKRRWTAIDRDGDDCHRDCSDEALGQTEVSAGMVFAF